MTHCTIDWSPLSPDLWNRYFCEIRRSTLLQHFPFAQANRIANNVGARHGVIEIDGKRAGLVQLSEVGILRNLIQAVSLDRGPLWFDGFGTAEHAAVFFQALAKLYPKRFGRKVRILPELKDNWCNRRLLDQAGFRRREAVSGYETIWLNLEGSPEKLRSKLHGKWRNALSKSERSSLVVKEDWSGESLLEFMLAYELDLLEKDYSGPSTKLITELMKFMVPRGEAVILNATDQGRTVAAILVFLHGASATYQVGWTTDRGRRLAAHHHLLWRAMLSLKERGIRDLDLGGVNDEGAAGIKRFKTGLGGEEVALVGFFN